MIYSFKKNKIHLIYEINLTLDREMKGHGKILRSCTVPINFRLQKQTEAAGSHRSRQQRRSPAAGPPVPPGPNSNLESVKQGLDGEGSRQRAASGNQ